MSGKNSADFVDCRLTPHFLDQNNPNSYEKLTSPGGGVKYDENLHSRSGLDIVTL